MRIFRNVALSCAILGSRALRTALSVSGLAVGVAAVIVMVSLGRGAERELVERVRSMGTNLVLVLAAPARPVPGRARQQEISAALSPADAGAIVRDCPSVEAASPAVHRALPVRWESRTATTTVLGMTPEGFSIRGVRLRSGRPFDEEEDRARRRVAVIGPTVAERIFGAAHPVGLTLRVGKVPFEVIGVAVARGLDANGTDQDDVVLVPLGTAMRRLLNVSYVQTLFVQARSSARVERAGREVREALRERRRVPEGRPEPFTVKNASMLLETERAAARAMTFLTGGVAAIAMGVGGVGILAVMLLAVRERTAEIGLRRAVGATRGDIRLQFLIEAAILSAAGGLLGVAAGVGGAVAASASPSISWPVAAGAFGISVLLGVAFGAAPAARAARIEPIAALRG